MTKEEFEKLSEDLKMDILREIAYEYAVFVPKDEPSALSKFKSMVYLTDKQFLDSNVLKTAHGKQIFPYNVITEKIDNLIDDYYKEFSLDIGVQGTLADYGERGEKFITYFKESLDKSKKTTKNVVRQELLKHLSVNDVKSAVKGVGNAVSFRTTFVDKLIESLSEQMEQFMVLWDYQDKGYTKYRINATGKSCEECQDISGKILNITDAVVGETFTPLHPNCDCSLDILDEYGNVVYTNAKAEKDNRDWGKYLQTSLKQLFSKYTNVLGNLAFMGLNSSRDQMWKGIALGVSAYGWQLTADLLWLAASGSGNTYSKGNGSYASNLIKNDKGINDFVNAKIWDYGTSKNNPNPYIPTLSYEIPLGNGDLGAALHNVNVDISAHKNKDGSWTATVKISDVFDFTEFKNPFKQGTILKGLLWAANDIAYFDTEWGLLDSVNVDITYQKKY